MKVKFSPLVSLVTAKLIAIPAALLTATLLLAMPNSAAAKPIRVVVWDEREAAQKQAYDGDYLGNTLAAYLAKQKDMTVKSVGLDDPEQGLSDETLDNCDVLIWWGHERHGVVTDAHVDAILKRLKEGRLGFIALHSAHWSKPFIAAMETRAVDDALQSVQKSERDAVRVVKIPGKRGLTGPHDALTPSFRRFKADDGADTLEIHLPACVFSVVRADGEPSHVTTLLPKNPIAKGIPGTFDIPQSEVYGGTFTVPKPDAVVFEEKWDDGNTFTSGCEWRVEKGKVFYFRPGHEIYPIYKEEIPLKIVANAVRWVRP